MRRFASLLVVVFLSPLSAQDIKVKVGETIPVSLRVGGDDYAFGIAGGVTWKQEPSDPNRIKLQITGLVPGSAMISVSVYNRGVLRDVSYVTIAVIGDPGPAPIPIPPIPIPPIPVPPDPVPPEPIPPPIPIVSSVWLIVVEETGERTVATAKVMNNLAYWQGLKAKGQNYRFYDKDSTEAKAKGYSAKAATVGLPALLILDPKTGTTIKAVKLPATTAEIDKILKEITGK